MPFELLLHFVVEFVQVLREQVQEQLVVDKRVAVRVEVHIARVLPWVEPLS